MKTRFTTIDIVSSLAEINRSATTLRIVNVYDIDSKTYLFKLSSKDAKAVILMESGSRIHMTEFNWPKNQFPSGFSMKLRKHLGNKRLESATQLGVDRIVDLQFGSGEAAYHVILELYDRGNIVLTDYQYLILNILRPRTEGEDVKFLVKETYPVNSAKQEEPLISEEKLREIILRAKIGDPLRKVLNPNLNFGPAVIDHVLLEANFAENCKIGKDFDVTTDISRLHAALETAKTIMDTAKISENSQGFIIQSKQVRAVTDATSNSNPYLVYNEFHPLLFKQHENLPYLTFPSFNKAVDEFFSKIESQKIDIKAIQKEKEALKKLENVKKDHEQRLNQLQKTQSEDVVKGQLIEMNLDLVEKAIKSMQGALASQINWKEIGVLLKEAQNQADPVANSITKLKLETNHITMKLFDPYENEVDEESGKTCGKPVFVDIDLDLTAYTNARKYYDMKRYAAKKEQKTIESSMKAYKSAERKTLQTLKDVATVTTINKMQKSYWFEKFFWFVSSENYLVIGGRDQQQNELIVKRYLSPGDVYVHADLHGASSIIIKNPTGNPIPPKTLNEAGTMAVCYSVAWTAKVVTNAWWVYHHQVSKTAPSGEYLSTGSFMIRGKKNYLPPCFLIMGFGFLFKLSEESIVNHVDERKVKNMDDDQLSDALQSSTIDEEIVLSDFNEEEEDSEDDNSQNKLDTNRGKASSDDSGSELDYRFPDTQINLDHVHGEKNLEVAEGEIIGPIRNTVEEPPRKIKGNNNKSEKKQKTLKSQRVDDDDKETEGDANDALSTGSKSAPVMTRWKKNKIKKLEKKYKDHDEEDLRIAAEIINAAKEINAKKKSKQKNVKSKTTSGKNQAQKAKVAAAQTVPKIISDEGFGSQEQAIPLQVGALEDEDQGSDEEKDGKTESFEDGKILDSLTAGPIAEDVIMFAMPVCAPYTCMMNYKYKVKLTPGTGKRGKAAKTALNMFMFDKTTTQREKDLLKSVKDQDISRNLPGKVKVSAPQLQLQRQKKR